jgi:hypothetical protein
MSGWKEPPVPGEFLAGPPRILGECSVFAGLAVLCDLTPGDVSPVSIVCDQGVYDPAFWPTEAAPQINTQGDVS